MQVRIGNIFDSKMQTIVNTINCVGVMGKGIALEFKNRYPDMYKEYVGMCARGEVSPGKPYLYSDMFGTFILNFPTKNHWKSPSKLSYIVDGLDWFVGNYSSMGITSVAFPPLGCGNGGLSWELVGPIMYRKLKDLPIEIEIYAPYGTKPEQLTIAFLENNYDHTTGDVYGAKQNKRNRNWDLLMYVVQQLSNNRYSLYVGRTIFQKICYIMTRQGIETGFVFSKGNYGPYSKDIEDALTVLFNSNILQETSVGKMMHITVCDSFVLDKSLYSQRDMDIVDRTIDLFSRVKNTAQAEMIATVLYSYDCLSRVSQDNKIMDHAIYDFVVDWKPLWKIKKSDEICDTIFNMCSLGWLSASYSGRINYSHDF